MYERTLRHHLLALLAATALLTACGSQFSDPILEQPGPPAATPCPSGYVAQLEGSAYASAPRLIQDDFTIEAWLKTNQSASGAGFADGSALVYADVETLQVDDFAAGLLNDKFVTSIGGPDTPVTSTSSVATGEWVHVAAVRTRANGIILVFVNGVLEGAAVGNDHSLADSPSISIGGRAGRNFYTGLLAEIRLWQSARSQRELTQSMRQRLRGDEAGLVGYYRLDDGAGTTAHDSSPSQNDAPFMGPVSWTKSSLPFCAP